MGKLRTMWKKNPGFVVACGGHALLFVFLVAEFAHPVTVTDPTESVSVEMVTTSQLDQIMQGEKTARAADKPRRRVDKTADLEDHKPAPPLAEAKKDTPPPPAPEKANDDPGEDTKPPQPIAALPPPPLPEPTPVNPTPPAPMPPERPVEKAETKPTPTPPPKPEAVKEPPPPPDAEASAPKPPPRPKVEPKIARNEPAPEAKPVPRPPVKEAKQEPRPEPPKRPDPPKKDTKQTLDQVAKLLDTMKPPKPVVKTRSGNEAKEAKAHSDFNPDQISAMLSHEAPQRKASTGRQLTQLASLGAPTGHADKMSLSLRGDLDNWLKDHYLGCWHYFGLGATQDYVPQVKVKMAPDGSLIGEPLLINQPPDANLRSLADSAIRAVHTCNPLAIPDRFKPYYDSWRSQTIRFDPKELS